MLIKRPFHGLRWPDPPLKTILAQNTAALGGHPSAVNRGRAPGYRKLALPGLKIVDFFGLKVISLGHHVFRSPCVPMPPPLWSGRRGEVRAKECETTRNPAHRTGHDSPARESTQFAQPVSGGGSRPVNTPACQQGTPKSKSKGRGPGTPGSGPRSKSRDPLHRLYERRTVRPCVTGPRSDSPHALGGVGVRRASVMHHCRLGARRWTSWRWSSWKSTASTGAR